MAIDPDVRRASEGDVRDVIELDLDLRRSVDGQRGGEAWLVEHPPLSETGFPDLVWVAVVDDVVVGCLVARVSHDQRGAVMNVDRVFVHDSARDLGFGDALLAACLDEARSTGCVALEATALPGDRQTKNLYERAGITARSLTLSRML